MLSRHLLGFLLAALLVLEPLARLEDARVVVTARQRAEPAEEVEDRAIFLIVVVHPLGALDEHFVESEQL